MRIPTQAGKGCELSFSTTAIHSYDVEQHNSLYMWLPYWRKHLDPASTGIFLVVELFSHENKCDLALLILKC